MDIMRQIVEILDNEAIEDILDAANIDKETRSATHVYLLKVDRDFRRAGAEVRRNELISIAIAYAREYLDTQT